MNRAFGHERQLFKFVCYQCTLSGTFEEEFQTCPRCSSGFCANDRVRFPLPFPSIGRERAVTFLPWRFHRVTKWVFFISETLKVKDGFSNSDLNEENDVRCRLEREAKPNEINEKCSICFEVVQGGDRMITLENCTHTYHAACILQWTKNKNNCPQCCRVAFNDWIYSFQLFY